MQSAKVPATTHPFKPFQIPFHLHLKFHWHAVISILHQETEERLVLNPAILIDTVIACNCALFMRHTKEGLKIDVAFTSYLKRAIKYLDIPRHKTSLHSCGVAREEIDRAVLCTGHVPTKTAEIPQKISHQCTHSGISYLLYNSQRMFPTSAIISRYFELSAFKKMEFYIMSIPWWISTRNSPPDSIILHLCVRCWICWAMSDPRTCNLALEAADQLYVPTNKSWRLNERMYGGLTGLDKKAMGWPWAGYTWWLLDEFDGGYGDFDGCCVVLEGWHQPWVMVCRWCSSWIILVHGEWNVL